MKKKAIVQIKVPYSIYCRYEALLETKLLVRKKFEGNENKHGDEQIRKLAYILKKNGVRHPIIISNRSDKIVSGHGRLEASLFNGWDHFPVEYQNFQSEADETAHRIADNAIHELSELEMDDIKESLDSLAKDFDLDRLGLSLKRVEFFSQKDDAENQQKSSRKESEICTLCGK